MEREQKKQSEKRPFSFRNGDGRPLPFARGVKLGPGAGNCDKLREHAKSAGHHQSAADRSSKHAAAVRDDDDDGLRERKEEKNSYCCT